ncbi:MAG: hypothetical protein KJ936_13970 [Proteobacteria bacterium]|nr:hypothetical protein [Pseudomonadota bacterium]MBU2262955.1 hypothetical protein [Pseudomonadota bacterium]
MSKEETELREGQISIMVYGADKFGLSFDSSELDDRNYKLHFLPYDTERRFSEFNGVITFQRVFEKFEQKTSVYNAWTVHDCDLDALDRREKEASILIKNGGFIVFLLHTPFKDSVRENSKTTHYLDTDLVKRFLNWDKLQREDLDNRCTGIRCVREEFRRFFELYGAVWSVFSYYGSFPWRNLAFLGSRPASMVIADRLFFVPCLLPRKLNERKEEFYHLLTDAVVTCVKKLCIDLPAWADEFLLPKEQTLIEEQGQLSGRLEEIEKEHSTLTRFKRVLVGNDDGLVDDVVYLLTKGLGYRVNSDDNYREDIQILDEKGVPLVLGEVKGTTRGVKREFINQTDSHRERAGLSSEFPTVLIINTHTKNTRTLQEKDQEIPSEQVKHAVKMNILIIRTLDLIRLLVLVQKTSLSPDNIMKIFQTEVGWLCVSGDDIRLHKE